MIALRGFLLGLLVSWTLGLFFLAFIAVQPGRPIACPLVGGSSG
jgi:hypothetical protein